MVGRAVRVGHVLPGEGAGGAGARDEHLEGAGGQIAPGGGDEPVEAAVGLVLGQVDDLAHRVGGGRLVLEAAHRRAAHGRVHAERVGLVDVAAADLLAGQPGVPRGRAAGAVLVGVGEDPVGAGDRCPRSRTGPRSRRRRG